MYGIKIDNHNIEGMLGDFFFFQLYYCKLVAKYYDLYQKFK